MYQIKNVVNYDAEALDQEIGEEMERFRVDKRIPLLNRRLKWIQLGPVVVSLFAFGFTSAGLVLSLMDRQLVLSLIMDLVGLGFILFNLFVLRPKQPSAGLKCAQELKDALEAYFNSPAIQYHSFIHFHGAENVEIWGVEANDSKFEVTLSKKVDGELKQAVLLFDYSERDPDGVLVLDIKNETVCRIKP